VVKLVDESVRQREASEDATTDVPVPSDSPPVSDVALAESLTAAAPSFPAPGQPAERAAATQPAAGTEPRAGANRRPLALLPGARVDDFEIVRLLGRGAFGHVYLARQLSLDRLVALKVSANRGSEGRTMARLEHQHIVQVYSENVDPDFNQRLLCMQLVPGLGLERLIAALHAESSATGEQGAGSHSEATSRHDWTGAELLAIIDQAASLPAALDPSALHDRAALARMDAIEATAWFGARLAEALDFAHHHGVLHRDIKPANILVNSYGRPLLADFNISSQPVGSEPSGDEMFGGTFAYMAPEHIDAFNPDDPTEHDAVTPRSDIYSLGLVLQQLLEGRTAFTMPARRGRMGEMLRAIASDRRRERPRVPSGPPSALKTLQRTIARCLEPHPDDRFASGAELAEQLDGCRHLREAERQLPRGSALVQAMLRRPFLWLILLTLLPQVVGSIVNISYNASQIVGELTAAQQKLFVRLVIGYNAVVYPAAIVLFLAALRPVWQCWRTLEDSAPVDERQVETARRRALRLPRWIAWLTAAGWFPGGFIFPLVIYALASPLDFHLNAHFVASFCLSGLVALAYSLAGVQLVVLRALYPRMWSDVRGLNETTRRELAPMASRLSWIESLAGSIPLVGVLMIAVGGETEHASFPLLVSGLILLGMFGWHFTGAVVRSLSQVVVVLTGTKP
jgi:eukaryotic-like serine/threonine-protein kinase